MLGWKLHYANEGGAWGCCIRRFIVRSLQWRHNGRDGVSNKLIECLCSELMQFLMSLMFLWRCHGDVASLCFWDCMFHAVYRIFKVYLRTLDFEHRIYRRKRNLLNLPYSPMITICPLSIVMICVKRSQIWSNGYCPCYMFHVCFFRFFSCLFLHFNHISNSSTTSPDNGYCQLPCVVLSWHT